MFAISLIFSGIAFFLNGFLPLIEENDNNEIVIMNVLAGLIVTTLSMYGIFLAVDTGTLLTYCTLLLFGITNLYVSAICIWDLSEQSLGWFSALIALITLVIGIYYVVIGNVALGVLWLIWMFIWASYFVSRALDKLHNTASYVIMFEGVIALVGVGILLLTGVLAI